MRDAVKLTAPQKEWREYREAKDLAVALNDMADRMSRIFGRETTQAAAMIAKLSNEHAHRKLQRLRFGALLSTSDARAPSVEEGKHG